MRPLYRLSLFYLLIACLALPLLYQAIYGANSLAVASPLGTSTELLVFDVNRVITKSDHGFPIDEPPMSSANGDWTKPVNFAEGTLYYRIEIRSQPVAQNMRQQFCIWQYSFTLENCGYLLPITGSTGAVATGSEGVADLWKKDGLSIDWVNPRQRYGVAIKNTAGLPVSDYAGWNWNGEDPDKWYPLDMRFTVVVVAKGATFSGWENYVNGSSTSTPTPTATKTSIPPTSTATATATHTNTPVPPTATSTPTPTSTATATSTATETAASTLTSTSTPTSTATPTSTTVDSTPTATATPTATEVGGLAVDPNLGATLTYTATNLNSITFDIPAGAVDKVVELRLQPNTPSTAPAGFTAIGLGFTLDAFDQGVLLDNFVFKTPISVSVRYQPETLVGVDETNLLLYFYDEANQLWRDAATSCTPSSSYVRKLDENYFAVDICHLSQFAVFGRPTINLYLPVIQR